ncbi:MAG: hypothetical protein ACREH8_22555 [Opitutaceae bacterium]
MGRTSSQCSFDRLELALMASANAPPAIIFMAVFDLYYSPEIGFSRNCSSDCRIVYRGIGLAPTMMGNPASPAGAGLFARDLLFADMVFDNDAAAVNPTRFLLIEAQADFASRNSPLIRVRIGIL